MRRSGWIAFILLFFISYSAVSDNAFSQRQDVQKFIKDMVQQHHFNAKQLTEVMNQVQIQPRVIQSMDKPFEKRSWDEYKNLFLTAQRLKSGIDYWTANQATLERAQKRYGVPPEIIVAVLGVETSYGERQFDFRVLDALATLAFNYPKRAPYFSKELKEYLLLCRELGVKPTQFYGSYAGAIGKPQFMPSSYRYYAVDFDNKGKRDLIDNNADSIGSIANYLQKHGWKLNQGIAQQAQLKKWRFKRIHTNPKTANYNYLQLEQAGINPITAAYHHPARAGLIELETRTGKEYWLAYPNFFVITRYNSSPQYALVVYLLSQQLKQQWLAQHTQKIKAYA